MNNEFMILTPKELTAWGEPQVLLPGAKDIILYGNPGKKEHYTFRFQLPKNYKIQPFIVTTICFLTIIEGDIYLGKGAKFVEDSMDLLPTLSFCAIPAKIPVYMMTIDKVILQFHGMGSIAIDYVDKQNDPRELFG